MSILHRVRNLWQRERLHAEIGEELRPHLERAAEDAERAGMPPEEARRTARRRPGNESAMRERTAEADSAPALDGIWRDLRRAVRQLRRSPGFTATAVVTLALGIGATTAIFTLLQQVMLKSLPVARPDQLWRVGARRPLLLHKPIQPERLESLLVGGVPALSRRHSGVREPGGVPDRCR